MSAATTNGWQPIETAPRDGTQLLGWCGNGQAVIAWEQATNGPGASGYVQLPGWRACANGLTVDDEGWDTGHGFKLGLQPTHWRLLPPPPTEHRGGGV